MNSNSYNNYDSINIIKNKKYMRIQGEEIAYKTKKPVGIFVLTWRRVRDGIYSDEDKNTYLAVDKWFKENLPELPFYKGETFSGVDYELGLKAVDELKKYLIQMI